MGRASPGQDGGDRSEPVTTAGALTTATVYLAEDLKHGRQVAIKVLDPELAASVGGERFLREIEIAAGLEHPHILSLIDSGEADGLFYYVMPYVDGESLRDRLEREKQLPIEEAIRIAREVADGLGHAHRQGVVHRDIKPANVLLSNGHALIADFGVARAVGVEGQALTRTGLSVGTPAYMSPEQASSETEVDGRADLYSLGCVLYEVLAGEVPFSGATAHSVIGKKLSETVPHVTVVRETVPPAVERALMKILARSPVDRFRTAEEFAAALVADAEADRRQEVPGRPKRQLAIGAVALLAIGAGVWATATWRSTGPEPADPTAIPLDSMAIAVLPFQVIGADSTSPTRLLARSIGKMFEIAVPGEFGRRIAHPGSVEEEWRRAGGTPDAELSEAAQLQLGRDLGVGALVRGTVMEGDNSIVLAASIVDVVSGEPIVRTVREEGLFEQRIELVNQLIVSLLSRDRGVSAETTLRLRQFKPEAIQALLASEWDRALAADSTLVDAALYKFVNGETDTVALRYAWEHQDQLTERGRAYLQVLAAGHYDDSITTWAQVIAGYEKLTRRWPEWEGPWTELGEKLASHGALASVPDWRRRAREALEHIDRPDRELWHLTELAFMEEDTARARDLVDRFQARLAALNWSGPIALRAPSYEWRLAILEGDTAAATRALAASPDSNWISGFALADGRGMTQADRVMAAADLGYPDSWAWARGREPEWRDAWTVSASDPYLGYLDRSAIPVFRALLLGPSEDSTATGAMQRLERIAGGGDSEQLSPYDRTVARCWITLWRLEHGDTTGARETLRRVAESDRSYRFTGWAAVIDAMLTRLEGGDVRASLLRADSVMRGGPRGGSDRSLEVQNLLLARLLGEYGEPERALAAIRRRFYHAPWGMDYTSIPEYLREEAKLAAIVGDTTGAVEAYRHYFALRDARPDHPTWAASWDSMRVEYGAHRRAACPTSWND